MAIDEFENEESNRIYGLEEQNYGQASKKSISGALLKYTVLILVAAITGAGGFWAWQQWEANKSSRDKLDQEKPENSDEITGTERKQAPTSAMLPSSEDLRKGVDLYEKGLSGSAEAIFLDLMESSLDPSVKSQAALFLGIISDDRGQLNQAIDYYQRSIKLKEDNYYSYVNLAISLRKKGLFTRALEVLEQARKLNPGNSEPSMVAGKLAFEENKLDEAEKNLALAKEISPDNALASYNLGLVHKKKGKIEQAKQAFSESLKLAEQGEIAAKASSQLGIMAATVQDFALSVTYLQKAVILDPGNARYFYNLALVQAKSGASEPAILNLKKAAELGYENPVLELYIARLYEDLNKPNEAFDSLKSAYKKAPGNLEIIRTYADYLISRKDYIDAISLMEQLYATSSRSADRLHALYNLSYAYFQLQDWDKAEQQLEKLRQIEPNHEEGINLLGNVFRQRGENEKAISLYKKAIQLNPENSVVRFTLSKMYLDLGLLNETESELKQILDSPMSSSQDKYQVFAMMGEIYRIRRSYATALSYFEKIEAAPDLKLRFDSAVKQAETMLAADMPATMALQKIERAIALDPSSENARLILASALMKKGTLNARQRAEEELSGLIKVTEDSYFLSQAHTLRGILNYKNGIFNRALDDFNRALEYDPTNEQAFKNKRAAALRLEQG
jgi:tetratricopeptide (TPR) repeat protein